MKKTFGIGLLLLFIVAISVVFYCCNRANATDVVEGVIPVSTDAWRTQLVRSLQIAGSDEERAAILKRETNRLTNQLISFMRNSGYACRIDTILYRYGSGKANDVTGGDKKNHDGVFKNQPYAIVKGDSCFKDSMFVFIRCFNGTFSLSAPSSTVIGGGSPQFTIGSRKGINNYVDGATTLFLADRFNIALYEGRIWNQKNAITIERARHLYETDSIKYIQVTARVFPGDHFDLGNMTYNGKPAIK